MKDLRDNIVLSFCEDTEIPMFVFRNLKQDLANVFKRYARVNEGDVNVKINILKGNKIIIETKCLASFLLGGDNI